jgi:hypothetical protein
MTLLINGTLVKNPSFKQIEALTRTELVDILTDELLMDLKEVQGMTRAKMVSKLWFVIKGQTPKGDTTETPVVAKEEKVAKVKKVSLHQPKPCLCGCVDEHGNRLFTKGGTFRPGHDARYYAQLHKSALIGKALDFLPPTLDPNAMALIKPTVEVAMAASA